MRHVYKSAAELDITIIAHISPAVPPRPCSDPDAAAYSDPGDPGEREIEAILVTDLVTKKKIDITGCFTDKALELFAEEAYDDAMDKLDDTP
jgi:hypothetical protein